jgi:hypothetical protein
MNPFDPCRAFRDEWFEPEARPAEDALSAHGAQCAECRAWIERVVEHERRLATLTSVAAPAALDNLVWGEIAFPELRLARALSALKPRAAPEELAARVDEDLRTGGVAAASVGGLGTARAPQVLERLVEEELADPRLHRTRRFVGSLERVTAPERLELRLARSIVPRVRRWRGLMGTLAVLLVGCALAYTLIGKREIVQPYPRLERVNAGTAAEFAPFACGIAQALGGFSEGSR